MSPEQEIDVPLGKPSQQIACLVAVLLIVGLHPSTQAQQDVADVTREQHAAQLKVELDARIAELDQEYGDRLAKLETDADTKRRELYDNTTSVFERSSQEAAINREYQQSLSALQKEINDRKKSMYALQRAANGELMRQGAISSDTWAQISTTPLALSTGGSPVNAGGSPGTGTKVPLPAGDAPMVVLSDVAVAGAPQPGLRARVPISFRLTNTTDERASASLRLSVVEAPGRQSVSPGYSVDPRSASDLNWQPFIDLRELSLIEGGSIGVKLDAVVDGKTVDSKTLEVLITRQFANRTTDSAAVGSWDIRLADATIYRFLETDHLIENRRQIIGMDVMITVYNDGTAPWEAPISLRSTAQVRRDEDSSSVRSGNQRVDLESPIPPGGSKQLTLRFGGKGRNYGLRVLAGIAAAGAGGVEPNLFQMADALVIEPGDLLQVDVTATSAHQVNQENDRVLLTAHIDSQGYPRDEASTTGPASGIRVEASSRVLSGSQQADGFVDGSDRGELSGVQQAQGSETTGVERGSAAGSQEASGDSEYSADRFEQRPVDED